ncbi:hypothetical protein SAMN06297387_10233 [Streptomyces zhaozhouensis]|uniref:Uncharacterized protein n=1 Tax=Streptomyces zhaozhouensis TaxID=1300267 RepID=A0A286DN80_9ACTN|nr:hypothetical protein [Streptomyces zhaozhouensis]SOD60155.1 hypothetical protein SAMN06297387_10233 [Streptomyces zhaozhouensis]
MMGQAQGPGPLTIAADGSYAARLVARGQGGWCPERWTLDSPEPYAVLLPAAQPEERDSPLVPLADGRVLIGRRTEGRYHFSLLYPSTPDTGELALGAVECERLTLLPPAPDGARVYALAPQPGEGGGTALWLVCGGAFGPELVTVIAGGCSGGAWLDGAGRLLAVNRVDASGRTRAVTVDVEHGGEPTELLRIAEDSDDRLLLADHDSGLLLVLSDAPGSERIGWGVLGSHRPVRFPESLHQPGVRMAPFAVQPGQVLMPEQCGVALRMTTADAEWVAVWRPQQRELSHLAAPAGWLAGTGRLTVHGDLLLPYVTPQVPCGVATVPVPLAPGPVRVPAPAPAPVPVPVETVPETAAETTAETVATTGTATAPAPVHAPAPEPARAPGNAPEPEPGPEPVERAVEAEPLHEPAPGNESHAPATPREDVPPRPAPQPEPAPGATEFAPSGDDAEEADAPPPRIEATGPAAPPVETSAPTGVTRPVPLQEAPLARTR